MQALKKTGVQQFSPIGFVGLMYADISAEQDSKEESKEAKDEPEEAEDEPEEEEEEEEELEDPKEKFEEGKLGNFLQLPHKFERIIRRVWTEKAPEYEKPRLEVQMLWQCPD
jgi:hypothetical protein